jgi:hypothetical protein
VSTAAGQVVVQIQSPAPADPHTQNTRTGMKTDLPDGKCQIHPQRILVAGRALNRMAFAIFFLFLMLVSICLCFFPVATARESVQVTRLANAVTVDGKWTTGNEWSDTNRVSMYIIQGNQSIGYVRLKHDNNFLYTLVDFISDITPASTQPKGKEYFDGLYIGIDQNIIANNTQCCDVSVSLRWNNGRNAPEQISPWWTNGTMSYDATNDPDSKTSHAIYELAIPMRTFEKSSAMRISVFDFTRGVNMHWPNYEGSNPSDAWNMANFGDLLFSEIVVPEMPSGAFVILASALFTTLVVIRRRRQRLFLRGTP